MSMTSKFVNPRAKRAELIKIDAEKRRAARLEKEKGKGKKERGEKKAGRQFDGQHITKPKKRDPFTMVTDKTYKVDRRSAKSTTSLSSNNRLQTVTPNQVQTVVVSDRVFHGVPHALIVDALIRGYANSDNPNNPYLAYNYMIQIVTSAAEGVTPKAVMVPLCLAYYLQAISPTQCTNGMGRTAFKFFSVQQNFPVATESVGPSAYNISTSFFIPNSAGSMLNGTIPPLMAPTVEYTEEAGASAFNSVMQFLLGTGLAQYKLVPITSPNLFTSDVSAFGIVRGNPGGGFAGCGGFGTDIANEVPIRTPCFVAHKTVVDGTDELYRWCARRAGSSCNDTNVLGNLLLRATSAEALRTKARMVPKFFDALEFDDVMFRALQSAVNKAFEDPQVQTEIGLLTVQGFTPQDAVGQVMKNYTCPLTIYEAQLMNRATYMQVFKDSQSMLQTVYPIVPSNQQSNEYATYTVSAGTYPLEEITMPLHPVVWVENLRASTTVVSATPAGPQVVPSAVGAYYGDQLAVEDYDLVLTYKTTSVRVRIFAVPDDEKKPDDKPKLPSSPSLSKLKEKKRVGAEARASLFDGTLGGTYFSINDAATISLYATAWNEMMNGPVSSFFGSLSTVGTDGGIDALRTLALTTMWSYEAPEETERKLEHPRLAKFASNRKGDDESLFDKKSILCVIAQTPPDASAYETILANWVTPVHKNHPGDTIGNSLTVNRVQSLSNELYTLTSSQSSGHVSLGSKHRAMAEMMTRSRNAPPSKVEEFLTDAAKNGRGGILSSLVSIAGGLAPMLGQTAQQLAPLIPL